MIALVTGLAALLALFDLFNKPPDRVLPWWGDVIVMAAAGLFYLIAYRLLGDDADA